MKIRIKGDSVRIRLSKSEIDFFGQEGYYKHETHFLDTVFRYGIVARHDITSLQASFENGEIMVQMPQHWADEWVATQRVGFDSNMPLRDGKALYILLEKDFQCLDNTSEDQSDMYPNPLADQHK